MKIYTQEDADRWAKRGYRYKCTVCKKPIPYDEFMDGPNCMVPAKTWCSRACAEIK